MVSSMCGDTLERSTKKNVPFLQSSMVVVASWSGAAWLLLVLGSCGSLRETWIQHVLWHSEAEDDAFPSETVFQHNNHHKNTAEMTLPCCGRWRWWSGQVCLQTWTLLSTCGASSSGRWRSTMCLCDAIMEEWKRMPATSCAALVNSMPRRIKAVLDNNGASTKYWHFGHTLTCSLRVYSFLLPVIWTTMAICWVIFRGQ